MQSAIDAANSANIPIEKRLLPPDLKKEVFGQSFSSTAFPVLKTGTTYGLSFYGLYHIVRNLKRFR